MMTDDSAQKRETAKGLITQEDAKSVEARKLTLSEREKFKVEYGLVDKDLVFHFFRPQGASDKYWKEHFLWALDAKAQEYFGAGLPRLSVEYIDDYDLDSWCFIARGYDHILDVEAYVENFYRLLENGLNSNFT